MTSNFESIFKDSNVNTNLNKLFSRKVKSLPIKVKEDEQIVDENAEEEEQEDENAKKQIKKFDPEYESRTVFVGNLISGCKKEVIYYLY
jgi:RNA recognition motif-containing protein